MTMVAKMAAEELKKVIEREEEITYSYDIQKAVIAAFSENPETALTDNLFEKIRVRTSGDVKVSEKDGEIKVSMPLCAEVKGELKCELEGLKFTFRKDVVGPTEVSIRVPK